MSKVINIIDEIEAKLTELRNAVGADTPEVPTDVSSLDDAAVTELAEWMGIDVADSGLSIKKLKPILQAACDAFHEGEPNAAKLAKFASLVGIEAEADDMAEAVSAYLKSSDEEDEEGEEEESDDEEESEDEEEDEEESEDEESEDEEEDEEESEDEESEEEDEDGEDEDEEESEEEEEGEDEEEEGEEEEGEDEEEEEEEEEEIDPDEVISDDQLAAFNAAAKKPLKGKSAKEKLIALLTDDEDELAEWGVAYAKKGEGYCCGLPLIASTENRGKCAVTGVEWEFDGEAGFKKVATKKATKKGAKAPAKKAAKKKSRK